MNLFAQWLIVAISAPALFALIVALIVAVATKEDKNAPPTRSP